MTKKQQRYKTDSSTYIKNLVLALQFCLKKSTFLNFEKLLAMHGWGVLDFVNEVQNIYQTQKVIDLVPYFIYIQSHQDHLAKLEAQHV